MATYLSASGSSLFDAAFLGTTGPAWWVGVVRRSPGPMPLDIGIRLASKTELNGIWKSPTGQLWVSGPDGVRHNPDPWGANGAEWTSQALDCELTGITGVDDRCVLARGIRVSDGQHVLRLYNGARWNPVAAPGFELADVEISAPDRIWACGGGLARWDGEGWNVLELPGFVAITAPDDGHVVAVREDGTFGRVTPTGFEPIGQVDGACCVAIWRGRIWIGAGDNGLWRAGGGELTCVRDDRYAVDLEAHEDGLLIACDDLVSSTADGERFPGGCRGVLDGRSLP